MINKDLVIKNLNYEWCGENGTYSFDGVSFNIQENFLNMYNGKQGKLVSYDTVLNRTDELKQDIERIFNVHRINFNAFIDDLVDILKNVGVNNDNTIPKRYLTKSGKNFIDILKNEMLSDEEFKGFVKGCMLKYIFRYENKGGLEDLKKADNYLKMLEDIERGNDND